MSRYVFSSHDGFGLGHVRRNLRIAEALVNLDPAAEVTVVTGLAALPTWPIPPQIGLVSVPALVKDEHGTYRNPGLSFEAALHQRSEIFEAVIEARRPHVVLVDRHPYGIGGELTAGLHLAAHNGAEILLGLRDVLDDATRIHGEIDGNGWTGVTELFSQILVYGDPALCNHREEYGVPIGPSYCGWVAEASPCTADPEDKLLVVAAGGGGDGRRVFELAAAVIRQRTDWRLRVLAGPFANDPGSADISQRCEFVRGPGGSAALATGAAVLQMAGYNATIEALVAGFRPLLLPRRAPRREQAIRAARLAAFGLADVIDDGACADEVEWLLDQPRRLAPEALARTGLRIDGAERAAEHLVVASHEARLKQRVAA
jgi:predicted glycosyltransferase